MKKISWITADYFLDVDLPVISRLKDDYKIFWQIVIGRSSGSDHDSYVRMLIPDPGDNLKIEFVHERYRRSDPRMFFSDLGTVRRAKSFKPDLYYISGFMYPWGLLLQKLLLPLDRVVIACHNVSTPKGASLSWLARINIGFVLRNFRNIQVFSKSQRAVLESRYKNKNVLEAPLALKDYGRPAESEAARNKGFVRFLNFGIIRDYKRVDLLIEAGCLLYEHGFRNFRILIAGSCLEWEERYAPLIKYPEVFELDIRRIPNEDVAALFARSDYFVMPYQDIAQSGAMTVAFQYNLPVIVSDLPQFKEFVEDGKTGLCFKTEDPVALADKMQYVLENHNAIYAELKHNQQVFVQEYLSLDSIVSRYREFFDSL
ncbi:MAG: glycosyltransferase [Bacteroidales bacterium]|nr:glycosyltransferase [Bacteroidales bacterium]